MNKHTEPMMDYCEFFDTEEEAIAACREVNRGLNSKDPACCVVVDGREDNYAVIDLETAGVCQLSRLSDRVQDRDQKKSCRIFSLLSRGL